MTHTACKDSERGAALLTVLLLVSIIAVIAVTSLDRLKLATRLTGNVAAMAQARAFLLSAEDVALAQITTLTSRNPAALTLEGDWQGTARRIPLDGGALTLTLNDGGNCFNLNGVVQESTPGVLTIRKEGHAAFLNLLGLSGIGARQAETIAAGVVDWVDSDTAPMPGGAEDGVYRGLDTGILPPNSLIAAATELQGINGMDAVAWTKIRPWVCALPVAAPVPININTLSAEQAIILSAFAPGDLPPPTLRTILAKRPLSGYGSLVRFWEQPELAKAKGNAALVAQTSVNTRFFSLTAEADFGGMMAGEYALIEVQNGQAVLLWRAAGGGLMTNALAPCGLLVEMPTVADHPLHWWRLADGVVVASGRDAKIAAGEGDRIVALIPINDAPLYTLPLPDLPVKQAEALAARQLAARSVSVAPNAAVHMFDAVTEATAMQGAVTDGARLTHGLSLLRSRGLVPDFAIPAAILARHIWWGSDAEAVQVNVMGEEQGASAAAVYPADAALTSIISPDVLPMQADEDAIAKALVAAFAVPAPNFLTGAFAPRSAGRAMEGRQWRTILLLLLSSLLLTFAIGVTSWWRFSAATEAADARAMAALSKAIGPQNDLASGESTLDARLTSEGRGAAVMSAPLSALYQAMQAAPQVSLRQLRYTPDGTLLATMAAPTNEAANAILLRLQQDGYKITATARTDDTGAQVVDVTIRGY